MVRARKFPVIGGGTGIWSFTHVDDAASATVVAMEPANTGIFNIVDDEPAEVAVWLPELARQLGAKAPFRIPTWLGRMAMGKAGVFLMTERTERNSPNIARCCFLLRTECLSPAVSCACQE